MAWRTRFTSFLPKPTPSSSSITSSNTTSAICVPLMGAPMAGVSSGTLAAETARAGALASLAAGHLSGPSAVVDLGREIELFRSSAPPGSPLCVGFICHSAFGTADSRARVVRVLKTYRPEVVQFFAPAVVSWRTENDDDEDDNDNDNENDLEDDVVAADKQHQPGGGRDKAAANKSIKTNVDLAHSYGCLVVAQVGRERDARTALEAGVDCLVAQGTEAGGHGLRPDVGCGTLPLAARIVSLTREWEEKMEGQERGEEGTTWMTATTTTKKKRSIPVLAAGGIVDGRGVAASLALGCDGAVLGTRLWASTEASGRDEAKASLASGKAGPDQAIRTTVVDRIVNTYVATPWPVPFDSSGILRNDTTERWHGRERELDEALTPGKGTATRADASDVAAEYRKAVTEGNDDVAGVYAGRGVGDITSIDGAYDIITRINDDALRVIKDMQGLVSSK